MTEAAAAGIDPLTFWQLTYRELYAALAGEGLRQRRARQLGTYVAWHTEAFARTKRLPQLGDLLRKMEPSRVMSRRELRSQIIAAAHAMGSKVTYHKRGE